MGRPELDNEYFEWLYNMVCPEVSPKQPSYRKLLMYLHTIEFTYSIPLDSNRADDGVNLRYVFAYENRLPRGTEKDITGPCSMLEMMVALAKRMELGMDDPAYGNRLPQWFWQMIATLGLKGMWGSHFDKNAVDFTIDRFLDRDYQPDGKGGLFYIRGCKYDLTQVEIWTQMCWYQTVLLGYTI